MSSNTTASPPTGVTPHARPAASARAADLVDRSWRPLALLLALFLVWWAVTVTGLIQPYLVPSPGATIETLVDNSGYLIQHTWITTLETVVGFALAVAFGVLAAVLIVYSPTAEKTLYPVLLFAQVIPKIAIAPLFIVWLGFGFSPKVLIAILIAFFPIVISMVAGLRAVDPEMLELAATMGAGPLQTFGKIRLPASLPHLFSGLKVAVTLAVTGAVVGEFVGGNEGLGFVILQANGNIDTPMLFAGLIVMSFVGVVLFFLIELAEKLLLPWHPSRRSNAATTAF